MIAALEAAGAPRGRVSGSTTQPMLATARARAFDDAAWVFEFKYDGYRILAERDGDRVTLRTRNGNDYTERFAAVARALAAVPHERFIIDGEVVAHDEAGRPSFQRLQQRESRLAYYIFDLLAYDDFDVRPLPLLERKRLLQLMLADSGGALRYSEHVPRYGTQLYATAESMGLEGVVGKRADSPYRSGRSTDWLKIRSQHTGDFVVVGFKRSDSPGQPFGSLHIAAYRDDVLTYAGSVGTGLTPAHVDELWSWLHDRVIAKPACAGAPRSRNDVWVDPVAAVEVRYLEWTDAGALRHPVFLRIREDKPAAESERVVKKDVAFSNLDKVLWPQDGYTKRDLIEYYRAVSPWLLEYLRDRPLVMTRFPDGIDGKSFFQKDAPGFAPEWLRRETIWSGGSERALSYFIADDVESLLYIANSASIPLHVWASRVPALDRPDWCVLDFDPKDAPFRDVVTLAKAARALCEDIGIDCFVKTSGSSGLHVLLPLGGQVTHDQSKTIGELFARVLVREHPKIATIERVVGARQGRVYIDYLQNGHGKLLVAPYSVRPLPGAPVSAPLEWREVNGKLDPRGHTIRTMPERLARLKRDPLRAVLDVRPDLISVLQRLQERLPR